MSLIYTSGIQTGQIGKKIFDHSYVQVLFAIIFTLKELNNTFKTI